MGVSADRTKYGNIIFRQLLAAGYLVQAVNPKLATVEENLCYANLKALPTKPEVANVVLPPTLGVQVVEDCLVLDINNIGGYIKRFP